MILLRGKGFESLLSVEVMSSLQVEKSRLPIMTLRFRNMAQMAATIGGMKTGKTGTVSRCVSISSELRRGAIWI